MTTSGQLTVAWEMLSSVVMLRAKAKEQKFPKLLSSLHGVEVELARIISGSETDAGTKAVARLEGEEFELAAEEARPRTRLGHAGRKSAPARAPDDRGRPARQRQDQQLQTYTRKYLALARQIREVITRGEIAACGAGMHDPFDGESAEEQSDSLLAEQHQLSLGIARLRASTFDGLVDKAKVLDDLAEEGSDDPVQLLARSLARDIVAMREGGADPG